MSDEQHHHDEEVLDGEAIEEPAAPDGVRTSRALEPAAPPPAAVSVTPQVSAGELGQRLEVIEEAMDSAMKEGVDYGKVPGTDKPALFKPGSEKLSVLFKLDVQPRSTKTWGPGDHLTVETAATVYDIESGARIGFGEGLCTTREKKYGKRQQSRRCPACGEEAIIKGKEEYGGGWLCFYKKGGCGAKYEDGDPVILDQSVGEVVNPDLPDTWNTVVKMAEKRARVDAVLAVTGASAIFTQDLDEEAEGGTEAPGLAPADEEQMGTLRAALEYILPPEEAKLAWGEIKAAFGGGLYGPAAEAAMIPIRRLKAIHDDERATDEEAEGDAKAQAESGESAEEKRERQAREKAGKKREKKS
jgi:hypothetical protein